MKNNSCIVCGNTFEPREGKLYCSESCKQSAYRKKKISKDNPDEDKEKKTIVRKPEPMYSFDYAEYLAVKKEIDIRFDLFCFVRRSLSGIPDISFIIDYIKELEEMELVYNIYQNEKDNPMKTEFEKFKAIFHGGMIEVIEPKPMEKEKKEPEKVNVEQEEKTNVKTLEQDTEK